MGNFSVNQLLCKILLLQQFLHASSFLVPYVWNTTPSYHIYLKNVCRNYKWINISQYLFIHTEVYFTCIIARTYPRKSNLPMHVLQHVYSIRLLVSLHDSRWRHNLVSTRYRFVPMRNYRFHDSCTTPIWSSILT